MKAENRKTALAVAAGLGADPERPGSSWIGWRYSLSSEEGFQLLWRGPNDTQSSVIGLAEIDGRLEIVEVTDDEKASEFTSAVGLVERAIERGRSNA